jgi:glycosyltransferase involved in cell wall biosynthesis
VGSEVVPEAERRHPDVALLLPSLGGGGAEKVAVVLATAFAERGLAIELALMNAHGPLLDDLPSAAEVVDLGVDRARRAVGPVAGYLRERRPRSLLAFMWPLTSVAVLAGRLAGGHTRMVLSEHTDWRRSPLAKPGLPRLTLSTVMRLTFPGADAVVAVSNGAAEGVSRFSGLPTETVATIHNPITPLPPPRQPDGCIRRGWSRPGAPRLVTVGNLNPAKDQATLLRALAQVRRRREVQLLILGEGPERAALEALRDELGLRDAVLMPGFVRDPQTYLGLADLFVLSSAWEGFSNAIVEALACGAPVVSTDCRSGPREILADGKYGDLVPVGDADALAGAILAALDRPHDRSALVERSMDFSIEKAAAAYLRLLLPGETWAAKARCV